MRIYQLSKVILSLKKEGVANFLNGLTSNEMTAMHNAFLTIHGKIVATVDQKKISGNEYMILIEKEYKENLLNHLQMYIKLGGVVVEEVAKNVYFDLDSQMNIQEGDIVFGQNSGQIVVTSSTIEPSVSDEDFTFFRLKQFIPTQGIDYKDELLLNVSTTEFVSFDKGCFLGQEPLSKVYNRSKPTWRLVVKNMDDCSATEKEKMTSHVVDPSTGKTMGFVFEKND